MNLDMNFSDEFDSWLASALKPGVPITVVAFSFNLFELESAEAKYGIELIGADEFDPEDSDWACGEAWAPSPRSISIPRTFANEGWDECLRKAKQVLTNKLSEPASPVAKLKETRAVAIGFVDGDLELIWQR